MFRLLRLIPSSKKGQKEFLILIVLIIVLVALYLLAINFKP
ncbi:MAG TPA: hypothetical protein VJA23_05905 [Candidatus Nanoarchaeia archaeon]|nr:hypothetical protein [Candidatus Nanoarchaeia archaeon]